MLKALLAELEWKRRKQFKKRSEGLELTGIHDCLLLEEKIKIRFLSEIVCYIFIIVIKKQHINYRKIIEMQLEEHKKYP